MALNDYDNTQGNILFAPLETDLSTHQASPFSLICLDGDKNPVFEQDDIVGKYVLVPERCYLDIDFDELAVGTGDFTLDFWVYFIGGYCEVANHPQRSAPGFGISPYTNQALLGVAQTTWLSIPVTKKPNEWAHYALVRKDGHFYTFTNGVITGSKAGSFNLQSKRMVINAGSCDAPASYCTSQNKYKALRVSNFARWTADFTPPDPKDIGYGNDNDPIDMNLFIKLGIQENVNLLGYILPVLPNAQQLVWSSDDVNIAAVDSNGIVTGVAVGKTIIRVKTVDDSWSAFARVKVVDKNSQGLRLSILLKPAENCELDADFIPEDVVLPVIWSSSNPAIASVDSEGKVSGIAEGVTVVSVKTIDNKFFDFIYVTVKA